MTTARVIVGVTGSSAPQLGLAVLQALRGIDDLEIHLVMTEGAERSIELEMGSTPGEFEIYADVVHHPRDLGASISSGSFLTAGMAIVPCSMKTLAAVATGYTADLVARAADVCMKERRRLVLVTRETPLNLIHIRNMETVTLAGAVVMPPVPAFYHRPNSVQDLLRHTAGKVLDQLGFPNREFSRWGEPDRAMDDSTKGAFG